MALAHGIAYFSSEKVKGEVSFTSKKGATLIQAHFTQLPKGKHGFHIHRAGDLRGEGCMGACEHYHRGAPCNHGAEPSVSKKQTRHTGDLGNIEQGKHYSYLIQAPLQDLFGRSVIVHADEDDLGKGEYEDSKTTGHSGARIGCAIIGRASMSHCKPKFSKTRKILKTKTKKQ